MRNTGFTMVEALLATALSMAVIGAILTVVNPAQMMFRAQGGPAARTRVGEGGAGGTRAIASVPVDRASRAREVPTKPEPTRAPERRGISWIWILILAAAAVAAFLLLNG